MIDIVIIVFYFWMSLKWLLRDKGDKKQWIDELTIWKPIMILHHVR
jgi:hypothetical protein